MDDVETTSSERHDRVLKRPSLVCSPPVARPCMVHGTAILLGMTRTENLVRNSMVVAL